MQNRFVLPTVLSLFLATALCVAFASGRLDAQGVGSESNSPSDIASRQAFIRETDGHLRDMNRRVARIVQLTEDVQTKRSPDAQRQILEAVLREIEALGPTLRTLRTRLIEIEDKTGMKCGTHALNGLEASLTRLADQHISDALNRIDKLNLGIINYESIANEANKEEVARFQAEKNFEQCKSEYIASDA